MQLLFVRVTVMFFGINFDEKPCNTDQTFPFDFRLSEISLLTKIHYGPYIVPKYHDMSCDI